MTLAEIMKLTQWSEIEVCLRRAYCDDSVEDDDAYVESHRYAYAQICELTPKPSDTTIVIRRWISDTETEELGSHVARPFSLDVGGIEPGSTAEVSLVFTPWDEWLGMEVAHSAVEHLTPAEIVTECLWEMTFEGYEYSEVAAAADELKSTWEEVESRLDSKRDYEKKSDSLVEIMKLTQWSEIEACLRRFEWDTSYDKPASWRRANIAHTTLDTFPYVESHRHAYAEICELTPERCDTVIVINDDEDKEVDADVDAQTYPLDVIGMEPGSSEESDLSFTPWAEWLGMSVASSARQHLTPAEIVTHCLWEMTVHGYDGFEISFALIEEKRHEARKRLLKVVEIEKQRLDSEQHDERRSDNRCGTREAAKAMMDKVAHPLAEITKRTQWPEVEVCLRRDYVRVLDVEDEDAFIEPHRYAYTQICELVTPKPRDTVLHFLRFFPDPVPELKFVDDYKAAMELDAHVAGPLDVLGKEPASSEWVSVVFTPWDEWLGMEVAPSAVQHLTPAEIVTHCLHVMTYPGCRTVKWRADLTRWAWRWPNP